MAVDESALVLVQPDDSITTIAERIRSAGARQVQMLVPEGTASLQGDDGLVRLRDALRQIDVQIISSDAAVLSSARRMGMETVQVEGAQVQPHRGRQRAAADAPTLAMPAPVVPPDPDDDFFRALEDVPRRDQYDEPIYMRDEPLDTGTYDDVLYDPTVDWEPSEPDTRDSRWDADLDDDVTPLRRRARVEAAEAPTERIGPRRPAPLLPRTKNERREVLPGLAPPAASPARRGTAPRRATPRNAVREESVQYEAPRRVRVTYDDDYEYDDEAPPRAINWPLVLLPFVALVLFGAGAAVWYFTNRAVVTVYPPSADVSQRPFELTAIPLVDGAVSANEFAIQAVPISATVEATVPVTGSQQLAPVGYATGQVTIINSLQQALDLPAGTELSALNAAGEEVRFRIDTPVTVPPATSSLRGVTFGEIADLTVTASAPGSASNIGENTIAQVLIPGQDPFVNGGAVNVLNTPMTGGDEQNVYIVSEADVQAQLAAALDRLTSNAIADLQSAADGRVVDDVTLTPNRAMLSDPAMYETPVLSPTLGTQLPADNPVALLTVRGQFTALATPQNATIAQQFAQQLRGPSFSQQQQICEPAQQISNVTVTNWSWENERIDMRGTAVCVLSDDALRSQVRGAVSGKTREEAEAALQSLQNRGIIGSYTLPANRQQFGTIDLLVTINIAPPAGAPTTVPGASLPATTPISGTTEPDGGVSGTTTPEPEGTQE